MPLAESLDGGDAPRPADCRPARRRGSDRLPGLAMVIYPDGGTHLERDQVDHRDKRYLVVNRIVVGRAGSELLRLLLRRCPGRHSVSEHFTVGSAVRSDPMTCRTEHRGVRYSL